MKTATRTFSLLILLGLALYGADTYQKPPKVVLDILNGRILWLPLLLILGCKWLATASSFGSGARISLCGCGVDPMAPGVRV